MARRGNSLSIATILKKAQRQGISIRQLADLTDRLIDISGQRRKNVTDDSHIKVKTLLNEGIRLHPFEMRDTPFPPMERGDGGPGLTPGRRTRTRTGFGEELRPPSILEPSEASTEGNTIFRQRQQPPTEDLNLPGPLIEDLSLPEQGTTEEEPAL